MEKQKPTANRTKQCNCCGEKIRKQIRIWFDINKDPDYVIAICPKCDTAGE